MNSFTEAKEFDKLKVMKSTYKDSPRRPTQMKMHTKQMLRYCGSIHPLRHCPAYGKRCAVCSKIGHFRVVYRSRRVRAINEVEQEAAQNSAGENSIDLVNVNSVHFNKNSYIITANLKMLAGPNNVMVSYKVDTGSDGNTMPLHIYKNCFLK